MKILAIDTSTTILGVAVLDGEKVVGEIVTNIKKGHAERLMPAIDFVLREANIEPYTLDQIAVAIGPGSYTGVRIGVSTAKSLAWALNIPIVGISSLEVIAYQGIHFPSYICPFIDARRGMVYTGLFQDNKGALTNLHEETNVLMDDWLDLLKKRNKEVLFISQHLDIYKDAIVAKLGDLAVFPPHAFHTINPAYIGLLSLDKEADDLHLLSPNYLRLAEAEANWLKSHEGKK